jgi:phage shock protein A
LSQDYDVLKLAYEKLQKEFQALRTQNADALASLKVLEEENEELMQELENLRNQIKNAATPKSC